MLVNPAQKTLVLQTFHILGQTIIPDMNTKQSTMIWFHVFLFILQFCTENFTSNASSEMQSFQPISKVHIEIGYHGFIYRVFHQNCRVYILLLLLENSEKYSKYSKYTIHIFRKFTSLKNLKI